MKNNSFLKIIKELNIYKKMINNFNSDLFFLEKNIAN